MSDVVDQTGCIQHRKTSRYFTYYEDFQDIAPDKHEDKLAAFLRILEVKTNKKLIAYSVLMEEAVNNGQPLPPLNLWLEISYNAFVKYSLQTMGRSSFQIADKEAEKLMFAKSRVLKRPFRSDDPDSPLVEYKEYLLVIENVQAALDGKEPVITGEAFEKYGSLSPNIENIPVLKKTWDMLHETRDPLLEKTAPRVENNNIKVITKDNYSKERESTDSASDDAHTLAEVLQRLQALENENAQLRSQQAQQLSTSVDKPAATVDNHEPAPEVDTFMGHVFPDHSAAPSNMVEPPSHSQQSATLTQQSLPDGGEPATKPTRRRSKKADGEGKPKEENPKPVRPTQEQIDKVFTVVTETLGKLYQSIDPNFKPEKYEVVRTKKATDVVKSLIAAHASPALLKLVIIDMWNEVDPKGVHWWRKRGCMTMNAIGEQYTSRAPGLASKLPRVVTNATSEEKPKQMPEMPILAYSQQSSRPELQLWKSDVPDDVLTRVYRDPRKVQRDMRLAARGVLH
jgi:hypothetical protein